MPVELSSAAKRSLRSLGRSVQATVQIGKSGVTPALATRVQELLQQRELIKIKLLESAPVDPADAAESLAGTTDSNLVAIVGRTLLLYKPNPQLPKTERIDLPR